MGSHTHSKLYRKFRNNEAIVESSPYHAIPKNMWEKNEHKSVESHPNETNWLKDAVLTLHCGTRIESHASSTSTSHKIFQSHHETDHLFTLINFSAENKQQTLSLQISLCDYDALTSYTGWKQSSAFVRFHWQFVVDFFFSALHSLFDIRNT